MNVVDLALRRPYTFIVMALLILLGTPLVLSRMATERFSSDRMVREYFTRLYSVASASG